MADLLINLVLMGVAFGLFALVAKGYFPSYRHQKGNHK